MILPGAGWEGERIAGWGIAGQVSRGLRPRLTWPVFRRWPSSRRRPRRQAFPVPRRHRRAGRSAGRRDVYEVLPHGDPQGVVFLPAGPDVDGVVLVEARLVVINLPGHIVEMTAAPAFTEYRLVEAERLKK
jgi:hypothetical protein